MARSTICLSSRWSFCLLIVLLLPQVTHAQSIRIISSSFFDPFDLQTGPMINIGNGNNFTAGVPNQLPDVRVENWNDLANASGGQFDLIDHNSFPSTVDVLWMATDISSNVYLGGGTSNGDSTMMNGHLLSATLGSAGLVTLDVTDLASSFDLSAGYDVIVYADTEFMGSDVILELDDLLSPLQSFPIQDNSPDVIAAVQQSFDATNDYDDGTLDAEGTYVRFANLTGPTFTLLARSALGSPAYINGFQIVGVAVPEPASWILAIFGVMCLQVCLRRRMRKARSPAGD
jgi:hypothetical protein